RRPCLRSRAARPASTTSPTTTERYRSRRPVVSLASTLLSGRPFSRFGLLRGGLFDSGFAGGRRKRLAEKARALQPITPPLLRGVCGGGPHRRDELQRR